MVTVYSCKKYETDFRGFLGENEIVYTGAVGKVTDLPGNLRVGLKWKTSSDPSITGYTIYWNNRRDSLVVGKGDRTDSVIAIVPGLNESVYSFTIYSFDAKGNKSVPQEVNNVRVYGPLYTNTLLNRQYNVTTPYLSYSASSVILNFLTPDTINVNTQIRYQNNAGTQVEKLLRPDASTIELTDYKLGTPIQYRSAYIPKKGAIDVFNVSDYSTLPEYVFKDVICDKSLFRENKLPNDVNTYEPGTSVSKLWDGSNGPQGYPNIFHSDGSGGMPHTLTFDMGKVYTHLTYVEETGRNCCNNPDQFEVWGIADISNAATTLPSANAGWKDEAIAKGWTLLANVRRTDDGQSAQKYAIIANPPPVRYIRVRILHVTSGDGNYSNISEMTFWNYQ